MTEHHHALAENTELGSFTLLKVLGSGGFGITYLAEDDYLHIKVAIKEYIPLDTAIRLKNSTVQPKSPSSEDIAFFENGLQAFLNEARVLALFEHPNIVKVRSFFEANNTAYMVMDYVEGETLDAKICRLGRLSEANTTQILLALISGLERVHQQGIFHRDIKPANIILRDNDIPVLIDFGAARQFTGSQSKPLTALVTPHYAPLEQYSKNGYLGAWTDIYALAAVAYTCLTGFMPIEAPDRMIKRNDDPLHVIDDLQGLASAEFIEAIAKGLELHADDRPKTLKQWYGLLVKARKFNSKTEDVSKSNKGKATVQIQPLSDSKRHKRKFLNTGILLVTLCFLIASTITIYQSKQKENTHTSSTVSTDIEILNPVTPPVLPQIEQSTEPNAQAEQNTLAEQAKQQLEEKLAGEMVLIEAGCFKIGNPMLIKELFDENQEETCVKSFEIGKNEVTQKQWQAIMGNNPAFFKGDDKPVEMVSLDDVLEFIEKLNAKTGQQYRLPTEVEWLYASALAVSENQFLSSDAAIECPLAKKDYSDCKRTLSHSVDFAPPNLKGLHHIASNVWEWTCSEYEQEYHGKQDKCLSLNDINNKSLVVRGGYHLFASPKKIRQTYRLGFKSTTRNNYIGFRLCKTVNSE